MCFFGGSDNDLPTQAASTPQAEVNKVKQTVEDPANPKPTNERDVTTPMRETYVPGLNVKGM